jgi:hypothetical protein
MTLFDHLKQPRKPGCLRRRLPMQHLGSAVIGNYELLPTGATAPIQVPSWPTPSAESFQCSIGQLHINAGYSRCKGLRIFGPCDLVRSLTTGGGKCLSE